MATFSLGSMTPCSELPETYEPGRLYLWQTDAEGLAAGDPEFSAVGLLCPCGCGDKVYLPLTGPDEQRWSLKMNQGRPTITPSIQQRGGCASHFFLTNGEVVWCP